MARATEDRVSRALSLLSAVEREDRRRAAARRRRHGGFLYATSLAALGALAAAPGVFAGAPKDMAHSILVGVGLVTDGLRQSLGLAEGAAGADAKPSIAPGEAPAGSKPTGLKIIVGAPPPHSTPCDRASCPP